MYTHVSWLIWLVCKRNSCIVTQDCLGYTVDLLSSTISYFGVFDSPVLRAITCTIMCECCQPIQINSWLCEKEKHGAAEEMNTAMFHVESDFHL